MLMWTAFLLPIPENASFMGRLRIFYHLLRRILSFNSLSSMVVFIQGLNYFLVTSFQVTVAFQRFYAHQTSWFDRRVLYYSSAFDQPCSSCARGSLLRRFRYSIWKGHWNWFLRMDLLKCPCFFFRIYCLDFLDYFEFWLEFWGFSLIRFSPDQSVKWLQSKFGRNLRNHLIGLWCRTSLIFLNEPRFISININVKLKMVLQLRLVHPFDKVWTISSRIASSPYVQTWLAKTFMKSIRNISFYFHV